MPSVNYGDRKIGSCRNEGSQREKGEIGLDVGNSEREPEWGSSAGVSQEKRHYLIYISLLPYLPGVQISVLNHLGYISIFLDL